MTTALSSSPCLAPGWWLIHLTGLCFFSSILLNVHNGVSKTMIIQFYHCLPSETFSAWLLDEAPWDSLPVWPASCKPCSLGGGFLLFFLHLKEASLLSHFKTVHTTFRRQPWPFRLELGYCAGYWRPRLDSFQDFWSLSHVIEAVSPETIQICLLTEIASSLPTANKGCSEARLVKAPVF